MRVLVAALIGIASGVASGAFGIGGALLSTPGIRWALDVPAIIAVGTTLPVIIPTAITGVIAYVRTKFVDMRAATITASAGGGFAILGALATELVPGEALLIATAVLIFILSIRMYPREGPVKSPMLQPTVPVLLAIGAVSGSVAGLLGVGGGVILVPVLTGLLRFPIKMALGTSLAVVAAQAIPGSVTHALIGNIDWTIAGGLVIGTIPGARIGSKLAVATEDRLLRATVAIAMAILAVAFGATEIRELIR
ncbi:MAG: sulfite exporter TauE/SafE family protein [Actinomycetota bacterium]